MRLLPHSDDNSTREGRLEICINHAWGSVCGDGYFDDKEAAVVCAELSGFTAEGKNNTSMG